MKTLLILLTLQCTVVAAAKPSRPATVAYPLFVGVVDLRTAPRADDPAAPPTLAAAGLARRAAGYPLAPELAVRPMARLSAAAARAVAPGPPGATGGSSSSSSSSSSKSGSSSSGGSSSPVPPLPAGEAFAAAPLPSGAVQLTPRAASVPESEESVPHTSPQQQQQQLSSGSAARRLHQASASAGNAAAPNLATVQQRSSAALLRRRAAGARSGFAASAPAGKFAGGGGGAAALAASSDRAVHVTGGALAVYALDGAGRAASAPSTSTSASSNATAAAAPAPLVATRLQDLFAPVGSSNCRDGLLDAAAAYDAHSGRFYVAAACGSTGSALLAVTAAGGAAGAAPEAVWYVYNLPADGVGTRLACAGGESALVDYARLNFNADAVAVTVHSYCPRAGGASGARGAGAALLVLPKGALARGDTRVPFAVFTSAEVADAAAAGDEGLAARVAQLEPAAPQRAEDVAAGSMYFVADLAGEPGAPRRGFLLVALVNTGAMWGFTGAKGQPAPLLAATTADRGAALAAPSKGSALPQPDAAPLPLPALPGGFWRGRAVLSGGKVWTAEAAAAGSGSNSNHLPTIAWTTVAPQLSVTGGAPGCAAGTDWGAGFDFSADASADFGAAVQPAWEAFIARAANASMLRAQAAYAYGREIAAADASTVAAAAARDPELAAQLARTDVSPFFVPASGSGPRAAARRAATGGAAAAGGTAPVVAVATGDAATAEAAPRALESGSVAAAGTVYGGRAIAGGGVGGADGAATGAAGTPLSSGGGSGRGGFEGWSCWSCGPGKAGFVSSAATYDYGLGGYSGPSIGFGGGGPDGYNFWGGSGSPIYGPTWLGGNNGWRNGGFGGSILGNYGPGPYGGGYGSGGWQGGYFGGFFAGSNVGGINWGRSCQIMCQRAWQGTGGVFGWGTGVAPNGWGPFGAFPFGGGRGGGGGLGFYGGRGGGGGFFGRRRRLAGAAAAEGAGEGDSPIAAAAAAADSADSEPEISAASIEAAAAAVRVAQVETLAASDAGQPACVAPRATCAAIAAASCPANDGGSSDPDVVLSARLVSRGALPPSAAPALAFAAPALAVGRDGGMVVAALFSGTGRVRGSPAPAYLGLASLTLPPPPSSSGGAAASAAAAAAAAPALRVEQRGTSAVDVSTLPAAYAAAWPAPPAFAVLPGGSAGSGSGNAALLTAELAPGAAPWVSIVDVA